MSRIGAAKSAVMTLPEVAQYLHCHPTTGFRLIHSGELPAFRLGHEWRVMLEDLDKWIAAGCGQRAPKNGRKRKPG